MTRGCRSKVPRRSASSASIAARWARWPIAKSRCRRHCWPANWPWLTSLELYLPQTWVADDRRAHARIPRQVPFRDKWRIALAHVRTVLAAGFTLDAVVADAPYGETAQFRAGLERL